MLWRGANEAFRGSGIGIIEDLLALFDDRTCRSVMEHQQGANRAGIMCGVGLVKDRPLVLSAEMTPLRAGDHFRIGNWRTRGWWRAANAAEEEPLLCIFKRLTKIRLPSPPYSNCPGDTCLTHLGTEGLSSGNLSITTCCRQESCV